MTRCHSWIPGLLMMVLLAMPSAPSWAGDRIGVAASTNPNADGITAGNSQPLVAGSEVYANETVRTGNLGQADLVFVDNTNLTVGPTSEARLDEFVYDPTGAKGRVVFQATRGAFRFATGTQNHRAYALNTPYGSLGDGSDINGQFEAMDEQARAPSQPRLHNDAANAGNGGLMSYVPGQYESTNGPGRYESTNGSGGNGVVEIIVAPEGKKLRPDECVTRFRLVSGVADYTSKKTKKHVRLTEPNKTICELQNGTFILGTSTGSILSFSLAQLTTIFTSGSAVTSGGTGVITTPCAGGASHCTGQ
jgi:FecR protein